MDERNVIVEQYRAYIDSKDRFIDRSFSVNRFYIVLTILLAFLCVWFAQQSLSLPSPLAVLAGCFGVAVSALWWLNQDAYAYLIKIKLGDVLEKLEESLPVNPHCLEYLSIKRRNEEKKAIVFADVQKFVALMSLFAFFAFSLYDGGRLVIMFVKPIPVI